MVSCYYTEIKHEWTKDELGARLEQLPEKLRQEALRKRKWTDRQLTVSGKLLLMKILKDLGYENNLHDIKYNTHLRPYLYSDIDFNIAHSGSLVICCGTNEGKIGIDMEHVKVIDLSDYEEYFTQNEWSKINGYPDLFDGFYHFWTRKEAVLKAIGTGFHTPLSSVDVSEDIVIYDDIAYYLQPLSIVNSYKCHVASTVKLENVQPISVTV